MMKNYIQFNCTNDFVFYMLIKNDFDIDENIKNKINDIFKSHENKILHIILFDEYFVIYENNNIAYYYTFFDCDIIYENHETFKNYDEFLKSCDDYFNNEQLKNECENILNIIENNI